MGAPTPDKPNQLELEDSKMSFKEDHIYEDPSNFDFISSPSVPLPMPPNLNDTASSQNNSINQKYEMVANADRDYYSEVDVPTHQTYNVFPSVALPSDNAVTNDTYSQLDANTMPRLHYGNVGESALISNDYNCPPPKYSAVTKSEPATCYSEPFSVPSPKSAVQHVTAPDTNTSTTHSQKSNYQPLLPPPRGIPCTKYQSLGPPAGYDIPSPQRNTSKIERNGPRAGNGSLQGVGNVPEPSLEGSNGAAKNCQGCDHHYNNVELPDDYVEMTSPSF